MSDEVLNIDPQKSKLIIFQPTVNLRYIEKVSVVDDIECKEKILQQMWLDTSSAEFEWRDVPYHKNPYK